jgi:hypothetical protein
VASVALATLPLAVRFGYLRSDGARQDER